MTGMQGQDKPSISEVLEHHGVKGQRWGVRKAVTEVHNAKINKAIGINDRVASGHGSAGDKTKVVLGTSGARLIRRGVKGAAAKNAEDLRAHQERLATGEATARDILSKYGGLTYADLGRVAIKVGNIS